MTIELEFSDNYLLRIFDHIPLLDLIYTVERVCRQWHRLKPVALQRRHRLVLIQRQSDLYKLVCCSIGYPAELMNHINVMKDNDCDNDTKFIFTSSTTSSTIFINDNDQKQLQRQNKQRQKLRPSSLMMDLLSLDALMLPNMDVEYPEMFHWLVRTLPAITHLQIVKRSPSSGLEQILYLLSNPCWSSSLVSVTVHYIHRLPCDYVEDRNDLIDAATGLLDAINALRVLRHLSLYLSFPNHSEAGLGLDFGLKLPILSQLYSATIHTRGIQHNKNYGNGPSFGYRRYRTNRILKEFQSNDEPNCWNTIIMSDQDMVAQSLWRYGQMNHCLRSLNIGSLTLGVLLRFEQYHFASKFTCLQIADCLMSNNSDGFDVKVEEKDSEKNKKNNNNNCTQVYIEGMRLLCSRFTSLTVLHLHLHSMSIQMLVTKCLSLLPVLFHLKLNITKICENDDGNKDIDIDRNIDHEKSNLCKSVQVLSITLISRSHHDLSHLSSLPFRYFPNCQILSLIHLPLMCMECDYYHQHNNQQKQNHHRVLSNKTENDYFITTANVANNLLMAYCSLFFLDESEDNDDDQQQQQQPTEFEQTNVIKSIIKENEMENNEKAKNKNVFEDKMTITRAARKSASSTTGITLVTETKILDCMKFALEIFKQKVIMFDNANNNNSNNNKNNNNKNNDYKNKRTLHTVQVNDHFWPSLMRKRIVSFEDL